MTADFKSAFIAMVGRPNVGKSTLMNKLTGEKISIISSKPQTTRNNILGILNETDYLCGYTGGTPTENEARRLYEQHCTRSYR